MLSEVGLLPYKPIALINPNSMLLSNQGEPLHDAYKRDLMKAELSTVIQPDIAYLVSVVSQSFSLTLDRSLGYRDQNIAIRKVSLIFRLWTQLHSWILKYKLGKIIGGLLQEIVCLLVHIMCPGRQKTSANSEYQAMARTACELIWIQQLLGELHCRHIIMTLKRGKNRYSTQF